MRESMGKEILQRIMYREVLPGLFSADKIASGKYLKLLGKRSRELELLDEHGVPRSSTWSVEHEPDAYRFQSLQNWGVNLYYGEIKEVLEHMLGTNLSFLWMDLDIQGSYLTHIDPAMTQVLLFCWRNPETLVATYHSVGRDEGTIWEGVKSLTLLMYCAPRQTAHTLMSLSLRYEQAGFSEPISMALRDLFWLRSMFEHTFYASAHIGAVSEKHVDHFQRMSRLIWEDNIKTKRFPLKFKHLQAAVSEIYGRRINKDVEFMNSSFLRVGIETMRHLVYNAQWPWSQLCHAVKFKTFPAGVLTPKKWLSQALYSLVETPLTYISRSGQRHDFLQFFDFAEDISEIVVNSSRDIYSKFRPRALKFSPDFDFPYQKVMSARSSLNGNGAKVEAPPPQKNIEEESSQSERGDEDMSTKKRVTHRDFDSGGKLTDFGKEFIKELAQNGFGTEDILKELPPATREKHRQSVIAYVAVSHRAGNGKGPSKKSKK